MLLVVGTLLALISLACALPILIHAFRRSLGTGVMVLCIPCFIAFYAFAQFEHRYKGALVAGWIGAFVLASVCNAFGAQALVQQFSITPPPV
ncbi:MAG: hypothetical protein M3Y59_19995 [Myxococcota bacterium]|nr:hypothetical protein [Myxococcota bacterium]